MNDRPPPASRSFGFPALSGIAPAAFLQPEPGAVPDGRSRITVGGGRRRSAGRPSSPRRWASA